MPQQKRTAAITLLNQSTNLNRPNSDNNQSATKDTPKSKKTKCQQPAPRDWPASHAAQKATQSKIFSQPIEIVVFLYHDQVAVTLKTDQTRGTEGLVSHQITPHRAGGHSRSALSLGAKRRSKIENSACATNIHVHHKEYRNRAPRVLLSQSLDFHVYR